MSNPVADVSGKQDSVHVLHVDDDPAFADMTATFLERTNDQFTVHIETSASEGLTRLAEEQVDCIVSDYNMPEMNGIMFLERVRQDYPDLPFILFTGKGSEAVASEAISAGVSDYLQKGSGSDQYELLCNRIENNVEKRRAEMNYRELFEKVHVGLTTHDPETGIITDVNPAFEDLTGFDRRELIGTHPGDLSPDDSPFTREKANDLLRKTLEGETQTFEWCEQTKDGEERWTEVKLKRTVIDGQKQVLAIVQDVTERKEREQEIETAKRKFKTIFENSNDAIVMVDVENDRIIDCNPAAANLVGYSREELVSMAPSDLHPHNLSEFIEFAETVLEEGYGWKEELTCYGRNGSLIPAEVSAATCEINGQTCLINSIRNISERKERERTLETKERLFEAVFNNPVTFMATLEPDGTVHRINETGLEFMNATHEEVTGKAFSELSPWTHSPDLQSDLQEWIDRAAKGEFVRFEADNRAPDGEMVTIDGILQPVSDGDDTTTQVVAAGRDITKRKARERELKTTASYLQTVMETVPCAVFLSDRNDRAVLMSEFGKEFLGFEDEKIEGRKLREFASEVVPSEHIDQMEQMHRETIEKEKRIEKELEFPIPGGTRVLQAITAPYYAGQDEPAGICGVAVDITERKSRETKLAAMNDRLDEFASVVSHDLRSPLRVAKGKLELAREECDCEHLDGVERAHERMETLIDDLLALARAGEQVGELESVALDEIAENCWTTVATVDATVVTDSEKQIRADRGRLRQLLENLFRNTIEHGKKDATVTIGNMENGIYVEDDGPGIPEKERNQVFDSGYSTIEGGTGFGLSIVEQVANAHGWEINITDSSSGGARFEITGVTFDDN
jgi:PAS domain S-box-containing protein